MSRLKQKYEQVIVGKLAKEFDFASNLAVPRIKKVVINIGIGDISKDETALKKATGYFAALTGQKAAIRRAKKSIAEFKTRIGSPVGLVVTIRGERAYDFLDRLFSLVLPRVRDFRGVKRNSFDDQGNYTLGLQEQIIFPEVEYDKIDKTRGMEITMVFNSKEKEKTFRLLQELGMPFEKEDDNG